MLEETAHLMGYKKPDIFSSSQKVFAFDPNGATMPRSYKLIFEITHMMRKITNIGDNAQMKELG